MKRALSLLLATVGAVFAQNPTPGTTSSVPSVPDYVPSTAMHSVIILSGNRAGDEFVWKTPDGKVHTFSQFNDRGRGPKVDGVYTFNEKGIPASSELVGNDYLKAKVDERFAFDGKQSKWKSKAEDGSAPGLTGFYLSNNGPGEEFAMLVRAALANDGKVHLLPLGDVIVEKVRTEQVELYGKTQEVTLYAASGLAFSPQRIWLDKDNNFFATAGSSWFQQVRAGGESSLPKLFKIEQEAEE